MAKLRESHARNEALFQAFVQENAKRHEEFDRKFDKLFEDNEKARQEFAELRGALSPWKLLVGMLATVTSTLILTTLGAEVIEYLKTLF